MHVLTYVLFNRGEHFSQVVLDKSAVLASAPPDQLTNVVRPLCAITDPAKVCHNVHSDLHTYVHWWYVQYSLYRLDSVQSVFSKRLGEFKTS